MVNHQNLLYYILSDDKIFLFTGQSLVALLHSTDSAKVARALVTVANAAAFTRNQVGEGSFWMRLSL